MRAGFIAVLATMLLCVAYVCWHLWRVTPHGWSLKLVVVALFLAWMGTAFAGFGLTEKLPVGPATVLYEVGHPWMIAFLYLLMAFVLADLLTLCKALPKSFLHDSAAGLFTVTGAVALVLILGSVHYRHKYREETTIQTEKPLERPMTIVLASDLHLGYHNRKPELERWIDLIDAENPDLVLIGGDILDRSLRPVREGHCADAFRRLKAPVWAVLGNHEYFSDVEGAKRFFEEAGIELLRDEVREFDGIRVIGRDDRYNPRRKPIQALVPPGDAFTLLLDHQPYHLEEAEAAGIDFQFSGHTHNGQVWPLSWVTELMYEKAWGHHTRGNTRYYVSSGLGIWGPKIRIGTRSEYLVLHIEN